MQYQSVEEVFNAFSQLKVLIVGDVMIDAYIWGAVERISPEAPVPVVRATRRDYRLGGAANVALNIEAMGASSILCAVVGNDEAGDNLISRLKEKGMDSSGIVVSNQRPTTVKTRVLSGHQHVVRVDEETDSELSREEESQLIASIEMLIPTVDVIVFEDYDKGVITEQVIARTIAMAKQQNKPTVVDPKKRHFLSYKGVSMFKPNFKELKEGLKIELDKNNQEGIEAAVKTLMETIECDGALITLSERGVFINSNGEEHLVPAHRREISDVSGAGDTVISVVALAIALQLKPYQIAALSNLAGGLVCEHVGVVPINKQDLLEETKKHKII